MFRCMVSFLVVSGMLGESRVAAPADSQPTAPAPVLIVPHLASFLEVAVPLPADFQSQQTSQVQLVEIDGAGEVVAAQIGPAGMLMAVIPGQKSGHRGGIRRFELQGVKPPVDPAFSFQDVSEQSLELNQSGKPVLVYNHGAITNEAVPANDARRSRACYVHPVWGLGGEVLTGDFPRDHYHHHGMMWTWPHVQIGDQEYDLWADRGIRQQFVRWLDRQSGPVAAVLGVENGWYVGDEKVMAERVWLRVYKATDESRSLDVELVFIPVDRPITLWGAPGKSYGGLTVRFAPPSRADENTLITVPDGPTSEDLKEARLAWADFTSQFGDNPTRSGAAVFVHPEHPDYPPTWLTRHYGPLCVGWPGVVSKTFPPGEPIRLSYRIWIHKSPVTTEQLQAAYDAYAASTQVRWASGP